MTPAARRLTLGLAVVAALALALPPLLTLLVGRNGLPFGLEERFDLRGHVRRLSWTRLDADAVAWGAPADPAIEAGAVMADFTVPGLLAKRLDRLTISGLTIHLADGPAGLRLRGSAGAAQQATGHAPPRPDRAGVSLPISCRKIEIRHGLVVVHGRTHSRIMPFTLTIAPEADKPNRLGFTADLLSPPALSLQGVIDLAATRLRADFSSPVTSLSDFAPGLSLPADTRLTGRLDAGSDRQGRWSVTADAILAGVAETEPLRLAVSGKPLTISPVNLRLRGEGEGPAGTITLFADIPQAAFGPASLNAITVNLPWSRPVPTGTDTAGSLTVKSITLHDRAIGTLTLSLRQTGNEAGNVAGEFRGDTAFPCRATLNASAGIDPKDRAPRFAAELVLADLDLKDIAWLIAAHRGPSGKPNATSFDLAGKLSAKVTAGGGPDKNTAEAKLALEDGSLSVPAEKLTLSGLAGTVLLSDLLASDSPFRGELRFAHATVAGQTLTQGGLSVHRAGPETLFLERIQAGWSGGTIHALGLSLSAKSKDVTGEIYCDRLNLAQALAQLGIPRVSGEGTLNGRVPFTFRGGKIDLARGFLYSTPGGGGSIRLAAQDLILAGIPAGTPQFGQLRFAAAALEDFSYNWLTMNLESKGDELLIAMAVDGHPAKPLPFRYDARLGAFTEVAAGGEIGINQPVRLDVNFRLPFNELLGYGKSIKTWWDRLH